MQIVKIKFSVDDDPLLKTQMARSSIKFREVLQIYRYDRLNFFTLEKITFKTNITALEKIVDDLFQPTFFQLLQHIDNEILCIMQLRTKGGFWPTMLSESWVITPPIIIDEQYVKISFLVKNDFVEFLEELSKIIKKIEIIAINSVQNMITKSNFQVNPFLLTGQPFPHFTERQHEIALYAMRHGYYESPKKISAKALAANFQISLSALYEHLQKAERTAMRYFFS